MSEKNKQLAKILLGTSAFISVGALAYYYLLHQKEVKSEITRDIAV